MWREFRDFVARGNVIDLAVAVIIGAAFGKIVSSLVEGVLMPPIGRLLGKVDFSSLFYVLDDGKGKKEQEPAGTPALRAPASALIQRGANPLQANALRPESRRELRRREAGWRAPGGERPVRSESELDSA